MPAKLPVLAVLVLIVGLVPFAAAECGDGICAADDTWETCPADCPPPEDRLEAEEMLMSAEHLIEDGEPGHETLKEAQEAFDAEEYERATGLSQTALNEHPASGTADDGLSGLTVIFLLLLVAVSINAAYVYRKRKKRREEDDVLMQQNL